MEEGRVGDPRRPDGFAQADTGGGTCEAMGQPQSVVVAVEVADDEEGERGVGRRRSVDGSDEEKQVVRRCGRTAGGRYTTARRKGARCLGLTTAHTTAEDAGQDGRRAGSMRSQWEGRGCTAQSEW